MRKILTATAILLVFQLFLVVAMHLQKRGFEPYSPSDMLASFAPADVDAIELSGKEEGQLVLQKQGDSWYVDAAAKVNAATAQVDAFLEKIAGFKQGLAVATSKNAAERFEVAADSFAHRVVLKSGGKEVATIYFGTSPGFKQIHARNAGSDEIVTVALGSHELAPTAEQWIDKEMLTLNGDDLQKIAFDDLTLERTGEDGWRSANSEGGVSLTPEQMSSLADKVSDLKVYGYADEDEATTDQAGEADLQFSVTKKDDTVLKWLFYKADENSYLVSRSDRDVLLKVSGWQIEEIEKLLLPEPADEAQVETSVKAGGEKGGS